MSHSRVRRAIQLCGLVMFVAALGAFMLVPGAQTASAGHGGPHEASGWVFFKIPTPQPACSGVALGDVRYWQRTDCGFAEALVSNTAAGNTVRVRLIGPSGSPIGADLATTRQADDGAWRFTLTPNASWEAGVITARVVHVNGEDGNFGETQFFHNLLGAAVAPDPGSYTPGDDVPVTGRLFELWNQPSALIAPPSETDVAGSFFLRAVWPDGTLRGPYGPFTANAGGTAGAIAATLPGAATTGLTADEETNFKATVAIEVVDASYTDPATGAWAAKRAGAGAVTLTLQPDKLLLENSFVSAVGWVKPGETYVGRVFVKNFTDSEKKAAKVTIPKAAGMTFVGATPAGPGDGTVTTLTPSKVVWKAGNVPARTDAGPGMKTLIVEGRASSLAQDSKIVWKNLSTTAKLAYKTGPAGLTSVSHGPKVIPPKETFDTARYGDRPFPVVPVDWFDRKHDDAHTGEGLANKINSPDISGSTFNLYQEMSYQQLFPNGTVPSSGLASAGWDVDWQGDRYTDGEFQFTDPQPQGTCKGTTFKTLADTPAYPERIVNGWYQMPGDTEYYGGDRFGSALVGAVAGVGAVFAIDDACGPTGKAVYDAAHIADPEIDYSDYDTDKDGVVDFFMMVYVGVGGHGASQTSAPPYDNIWPHSSSLEFYYSDPDTGQKGYISDDQLKDYQGRPLYYTDASRTTMTTDVTAFRVYVRVGPYNVNPESAIDRASVISHEYGHSLGLPDYYSTGGRETYGDWNLMATDKSQHMDVNAKQELGWLIPRTLPDGETTVTGWQDTKLNTKRIDWVQPNGTPYALTGPSVNNGQGYVLKLPAQQVLNPAKFDAAGPGVGATPDHVWWSRSGNDFGCTPQQGHNLDVFLPELETLPGGTQVTLTFKSFFDIEWDFDYGFVMVSTDGGETYQALPSANGLTTQQAQNPNANSCQSGFGNGITGSSGSYEGGTQEADRVLGSYPDGGFLEDEYDLSSFVGESTVLRFSYSTDPGLARPGWFVDDLKITAGAEVIYETDFESSGDPADPRVFNGGCKDQTRTAPVCTDGWQFVSASAGSPADHAYYLEMRDRSGFDESGKGENDRDPIAFLPGLLLVYTNEAHCYGNPGCDDPPGQTPLDSQPQPGEAAPNLHDAAWTAAAGDSHFSDSGAGHTDNYSDPASDDGLWHFTFDCLTFDVLSMAGNAVGPANVPPYDLIGDVRFTVGAGCAAFDYGYGDEPPANEPPHAVAQVKRVADQSTVPTWEFNGSASSDDRQAPDELTYEWDFESDGTYDATGMTVRHVYPAAGTYTATLKVTDADDASDTDTVVVRVQ